jgi:hypothetical protein
MTYNKLVLLHQYVENETNLISSFKDDSKIIQTTNETKLQDILRQIQEFKSEGKYPFNNLAFVYHFPGYHSVPFLETVKEDSSGNLLDNKYQYFNDEIIDLIKELGNELTVDLLSCDLKDDNFKEEVAKFEEDLNINIRYSVDQTGNNPQGNWVLESDNVDVKDLYFSETIDEWNGVLNSGRTITSNGTYFTIDGNTIKLKGNFTWSEITQGLGWALTDYITLGENQVFDGQGYTIDLSDNSTSGLFASNGNSIDTAPLIKNLGVLNGTLSEFCGYIVKREQNYLIVDNCYSTGNINSNCGGITGNQFGLNGHCIISNCYTTGNINGNYSGGICAIRSGQNGICNINNSYTTGNITGTGSGGITGASSAPSGRCNISNCYSTGNITNSNCGGICATEAGRNNGTCNINNCYYTGTINSGTTNSGGICGSIVGLESGTCNINNSYSINGNIIGSISTTGTVTVSVTDCYSQSGGTGDPLHGNYPLSDINQHKGIGNLGNEYIVSFTDNYEYPILKSNTGIGINGITYYDFNKKIIRLNQSVSFDDLKDDFIHNSNDFNHFILGNGQSFDGQGNTIDLTGIALFEGLFASSATSLPDGSTIDDSNYNDETKYIGCPTIKNLGILNGSLESYRGFLLRQSQKYFVVDNCYSTGVISHSSGGICSHGCNCFLAKNCYSTGNITSNNSGGICGSSCILHIIKNCYSNGNIVANSGGGICGWFCNRNFIIDCYSTGEISGESGGGICGKNSGNLHGITTIKNCYSTGDISGNYTGGIVGGEAGVNSVDNSNFRKGYIYIYNCYSTGDITGSNAGGIFGFNTALNYGKAKLYNCYSIGNIGTNSWGLGNTPNIGAVETVSNCYSQSGTSDTTNNFNKKHGNYPVTDINQHKGIGNLGNEYIVSFTNNYEYPILKSNTGIGINGITYYDFNKKIIRLNQSVSLYNLKNDFIHNSSAFTHFILGNGQLFDGQGYTIDLDTITTDGLFASTGTSIEFGPLIKNLGVLGGETTNLNDNISSGGFIIIKHQSNFKVDNCYSTGAIKNHGGGICGNRCSNFEISRCYSTGSITGSGSGGITGFKCFGDINNCYSTGDIGNYAGGIAGSNQGNTGDDSSKKGVCNISNCYSTGNIGGDNGGGICGSYAGIYQSEVYINNCYSTGTISGTDSGGIIGVSGGQNNGTVEINNCYSTGDISGTDSGGITGNSTNAGVQINNCYSNGTITGTGGTITGNNNALNGNYLVTDISNNSGIGNLGDEYIVSFTDNYVYPILKSNTGIGINGITYYDFNKKIIRLNQSVSFDDLKDDFIHNSNDFNHFILGNGQSFDGQGNTIDLTGIALFEGLFASSATSLPDGSTIDDSNYNDETKYIGCPTIKNLGILNGSLESYRGFLLRHQQQYFVVDNCYSTGDIKQSSGGICSNGCSRFLAKNCYSIGNITNIHSGGICGDYSYLYMIKNCYSTGDISANNCGGICGSYCNRNFIIDCYSTGNISAQAGGGICGSHCNRNFIIDCYSTGYIGKYSGGITGSETGNNGNTNIINCYSTGNIGNTSTHTHAGGICGLYTRNCTIKNCYSYGIIGSSSGGMIGGDACNGASNICNISNCYSTGDISGINAGGIIANYSGRGNNSKINIDNCYSTGNINGTNAGGIAGNDIQRCTINNCYSTGDFNDGSAGGIVGKSQKSTTITNCYSKGTITGTGGTITGNNNALNGNYPLSDINGRTSIGNLGNEYTISFLDNYEYPVLKSNLGGGLITSYNKSIILHRTVELETLQKALNHNSSFTNFNTSNKRIAFNGNYIKLNDNNSNIPSYKPLLNVGNLKDSGYIDDEIFTNNFEIYQLRPYYSASYIKNRKNNVNEYTLAELIRGPYTCRELREADISLNDLKTAGFTNYKIYQAGYPAVDFLSGLTDNNVIINELKKLLANNYSIADIEYSHNNTITEAQYRAAGYPEAQITENNITL